MTLLVACFNCGFLLQLLFKAAEWKSLPLMAASLAEGRQEHAALIVYLMAAHTFLESDTYSNHPNCV